MLRVGLIQALGRMRKFDRTSDVRAHISTMVLCCGGSFQKLGDYGDDQTINTEIAFEELRAGLPLLRRKVKDDSKILEVERLIDASLQAYRNGERKKGAHLLQNILDIVFPGRFHAYAKRKGEQL